VGTQNVVGGTQDVVVERLKLKANNESCIIDAQGGATMHVR
jgi:hypothetical protein